MEVRLTWAECEQAVIAGGHRRIRRLRAGTGEAHRWGYKGEDNWTAHIEAVGSEIAVAKAIDRYWFDDSAPDYDGDVGSGVQVRHTTRNDGRLIVHKEDSDEQFFWLVRGQLPVFDVAGFLLGAHAKQDDWWCDPGTGRPAFFVPASALIPPEEAPL